MYFAIITSDIYKGQFFKIVHILLILYHLKPETPVYRLFNE